MFDWIVSLVESSGYLGIFFLMVLEHLFPPIPSELIMPLSGFISSQSPDMSLTVAIIVGSLGSMVGTLVWYLLGRLVGQDTILRWVARYGRWLTLKPKDIEKAMSFFQEGGGGWVVGTGRVVPGVRTYVSVPAGLSHMPIMPYLVYSSIGTVIWTGLLAIAGYFLGNQFERVQEFIGPISKIVIVSLVLMAIFWVASRYRRRKRP